MEQRLLGDYRLIKPIGQGTLPRSSWRSDAEGQIYRLGQSLPE